MGSMSYGSAFRAHAANHPDGTAVVFGDVEATWADLEERSNRLARAYTSLGVTADTLVTIALPNGIEFFEVCLAVWKLGATPNPVSARLPEAEQRAIVETADAALLVGVADEDYPERASLPAGFEPDAGLSADPLPDRVSASVRAMTSGGSTGRPKVIIDLKPALCDPEQPENGMQAGGVTLVPGPLYHAGPFITAWQSLACGNSIVVLERFEPAVALAAIAQYRVDWVLFVPTMMQRIWKLPTAEREAHDVSSLRRVMCSGAPSPAWLKRAWIGWLGPERIVEAYGGSERVGGTQISGAEWLAHPGSVGKPTGDRKIRILDPERREVPVGEVGEVFMMPPGGQGSTYRYLGASATATPDGWESLGDMGYLDQDGYLYLVDRKTDMVVSGGANVYPAEIEAAIDAYPDVRSSAVIGLPDDDLGQRLHAIVDAPTPIDEADLRAHLAERLVRYKVPRTFEFVADPLRDDAGKVRRSALRSARIGTT
jgi:bile acid-coenzyme A ligase